MICRVVPFFNDFEEGPGRALNDP